MMCPPSGWWIALLVCGIVICCCCVVIGGIGIIFLLRAIFLTSNAESETKPHEAPQMALQPSAAVAAPMPEGEASTIAPLVHLRL